VIEPIGYDREALQISVVHLGLGAFSRAHLLTFLDDLATAGSEDVGVLGTSMTSEAVPEALRSQEGRYTVVEVSAAGHRLRQVGVLVDVVGPSRRDQVLSALAAPSTTLVTTTVTEKAYGFDPVRRQLDVQHPAVAHDLASPRSPVGVVGTLFAGLDARRRAGAGPLTVACCDNVSGNGTMLAGLLEEFATHVDADTARWIAGNVVFPDSMVDRIVPATTDELREEVSAAGVVDAWPVIAEPFRQWVLEDRLGPGVPALAEAGVQLSSDVAAWERMKLRVLNGLHSASAYLGLRLGHSTIDEVVGDRSAAVRIDALSEEIQAVLVPPAGTDARAYAASVRDRFTNPAIGHRCQQIAMDGSVKLPQRILPTIADALDAGSSVDTLSATLAWWVAHLRRTPAAELQDPRAEELSALVRSTTDPFALGGALMDLDGFAPVRLRDDAGWRRTLGEAIDREGKP